MSWCTLHLSRQAEPRYSAPCARCPPATSALVSALYTHAAPARAASTRAQKERRSSTRPRAVQPALLRPRGCQRRNDARLCPQLRARRGRSGRPAGRGLHPCQPADILLLAERGAAQQVGWRGTVRTRVLFAWEARRCGAAAEPGTSFRVVAPSGATCSASAPMGDAAGP